MTRRRRGLSEDDLDVWRKVARTANPLSPQRQRPVPPEKPLLSARPPQAKASAAPEQFRIGTAAHHTPPGHDLTPTIERQLDAHPLRMDRKTFGKLKRGKLRPERKLDLHGMTLAEAHPELARFVRRAHADGCRLVIVVTGKGRSAREDDGPIPTPRGVLRHQVPGWLHSAALRPFVLQVTDAHRSHGGSGAYYVYLRRGPGAAVPRG